MIRELRNQRIRSLVLARLLPVNAVKWLLSSYSLLALSILGLAYTFHGELIEKGLFLILLATVTCFVCLHSIIGGIFLFAHRNPYLNEWKEKLGYHEK